MNGRLFTQRTTLYLIWLVLFSLVATGCWDRREINDLAIVLAVGVDRNSDNKIVLSAQVFFPKVAGGGPQGNTGGSGSNATGQTIMQSAQGVSIADAMTQLQSKLPRSLFWGQAEVIVIGEGAAAKGIRSYIDFFLRYDQFREHAYVYISKEKAEDILKLQPPLERSSAEVLREMGNLKLGAQITLKELAQKIDGASQGAVLTRIHITPFAAAVDPVHNNIQISGLTVLTKDKYVGSLQEKATLGTLLICNELETIIFSFPIEGTTGEISVNLLHAKTKLTPHIDKKGVWKMNLLIEAYGDLVLNTTDLSNISPEFIEKVKTGWSKALKSDVEESLRTVQRHLKADIFGFAEKFYQHYPKEWNKVKEHWNDQYPKLKIDVTIHTKINRLGKSVVPQGIPESHIRQK
ncbi:Ger(x)C family spore germination protein [Paenibacillus sp. WQ 127069]|uniref:Ger(X)C family spore germination protein n=1 Tax=Paenibacillus baimaensis TaxID=2982185 RepID=A0ABT2USR8_9BACL|nr:Ger(x)C family spore germination protein [Paenibacillus sp. WQ 127069]MCU6797720.1 Ger(x)C family spore germination protein [Paenibacillus sp. WQ 127069]